MFKFSEKYKLRFDISAAIAAMLAAIVYWYDFFENKIEWKWLGGIVFGTMAVIKVIDLVKNIKDRKNLSRERGPGQNGIG